MNVKGGGSLLEETSLEVVGVKLCVYERDTERQKEKEGFSHDSWGSRNEWRAAPALQKGLPHQILFALRG